MRFLLLSLAVLAGCGSLPRKAPPLTDMEEPPQFFEVPDDEGARQELPKGSFTGIYVEDSRKDLDALVGEEPEGVSIGRIIENSPGDIAGLWTGDLLFEVETADGLVELAWPSDWRKVELEAEPGSTLTVFFDRAGVEGEAQIAVVQRVRAPGRQKVERYREEGRLGVVLRTATEVEARAADLAPGAGAVVVGLSARSPLRRQGIVYGDLVRSVGGREVAHPQVFLEEVRGASGTLAVEVVRAGERFTVDVPLSARDGVTREVFLPPLYWYTFDGEEADTDILFGFLGWSSTPAGWEFQLFWFFWFSGGDGDVLEEVDH